MAESVSYGLGLDQGVASIGWAILKLDAKGKPIGIERMGTHIFEAGTEGGGDERRTVGRDSSRAVARRLARAARKQYRRRMIRKRHLLRWLQQLGLMREGDISTSAGRDALITSLDKDLRAKWEADADHRMRQLLPYRLRAAGLRGRLEPYELGRALYHLAQRRGYRNNRRDNSVDDEAHADQASKPDKEAKGQKKDKQMGEVETGIEELLKQMQGAGCATLAEYFSLLDPTTDPVGDHKTRLRDRWTPRTLFMKEFEQLWAEQVKHHPQLARPLPARTAVQITHPSPRQLARYRAGTPRPKPATKVLHRTPYEEIKAAIFFQRRLQSASHLIGKCDLLPGEQRCPKANPLAQRFRVLQQVNNLRILLPGNTSRPLTPEERAILLHALEQQEEIKFAALRKNGHLSLPAKSRFNLEEGGEDRLIGNRTLVKCRRAIGDRWDALSEVDQDAMVDDLISYESEEALSKRGQQRYGLLPEVADRLAKVRLEEGYAAHSKAALSKLVERMEGGMAYMTARTLDFPPAPSKARDTLPPVESDDGLGPVRNPAVTRALTELRKVVNAIVRRYGKPEWIHIELARDLKRGKEARLKIANRMNLRRKERDAAAAIIREHRRSDAHVSARDIERVLLHRECGGICPYTGAPISLQMLLANDSPIDVEHIWPLSRCLDDSFSNKTLCFADENRAVKKNRTPYEAYSSNPERWSEILARVKSFSGSRTHSKYEERFLKDRIDEDFIPRRFLVDTQYVASLSAKFLGLLYDGGPQPVGGNQRVFVTAGGLTAVLRRGWGLNSLLGDSAEKSRADHRHHAIDALVVALTDSRAVGTLQRAARLASETGRRGYAEIDEPWPDFLDSVRPHYDAINVSYRQSRRVSGKLHAESNYSRPTGPTGERRFRKELAKLSEKDVDKIVDDKVRAAVKSKLAELKGPPNKVFASPESHPHTVSKKGKKIPIHKVRIAVSDKPWSAGRGPHERFVVSTGGGNHHLEAARASDGRWTERVVPLFEVDRGAGVPKRPHNGDSLTLAAGEFVEMNDERGCPQLYRVLSVSKPNPRKPSDIELVLHREARVRGERPRERGSLASLRARGMRKVTVTYLGEIRRAGG